VLVDQEEVEKEELELGVRARRSAQVSRCPMPGGVSCQERQAWAD